MANQFLVTMSITALAIGLIAIITVAVWRGAAPTVRNLVWNAALLACTVAPLALTLGPRLTIRIPATLISTASRAIHAPLSQPANIEASSHVEIFPSSPERELPVSEGIGKTLLLIWVSGMVFFAVRFLRQLLFARGLVRRATRATHDKLDPLLTGAMSALGIRDYVRVLESAEIDIPIATGILHPTILLPAYANEWTADELRAVLLHELAHVRRADIRARAAAMFACGLHWFNPVVWLLSAAAMRDAELAADDLVLRAGVRPSSYADTLLNLADNMLNFPNAQPAMSLGRPALLADRVHAILRESGIRRDIRDVTRSTVLIGSCAIATLAACIRFSSPVPETLQVTRSEPGPKSATATMADIFPEATIATRPFPGPVKQAGAPSQAIAGSVDASTAQRDSTWIAGATDGLIAALDDPSPQVRGEAAHSLGTLGAVRAQQSLTRLVNDPDKFVQYEARQALSSLNRAH